MTNSRRPVIAPETPPTENGRQAERLVGLTDCCLLISLALQTECRFEQSKSDLEAADLLWAETRQLTIDNNPRARKVQRECQELHREYNRVREQLAQPSLSPALRALQEELKDANDRQAGICKNALKRDKKFLSISDQREEIRFVCRRAQEAMEQAQAAVLLFLGQNFDIQATWQDIETLLEAELRQRAAEAGLRLAEAQECHEHSLNDISQRLGAFLPDPRNYDPGRSNGNRTQQRPRKNSLSR